MDPFVDRFGAGRLAGLGIGSPATGATGLAWGFPSLLGTRLVMGAGEASSNPAGERGTLNAIFDPSGIEVAAGRPSRAGEISRTGRPVCSVFKTT